MSGLIAEFGIDLENVNAPSYDTPADDIYEFTLGDVSIKQGSKANPNKSWIIFKYLLGEDGLSYSQLYGLPEDPSNPTDKEMQALGYYKQHLISLGVPEDKINSITADELVGTKGTLELRTIKGKDGNYYQNIKNLKTAAGKASSGAKKAATAVDNPFA